MSVLCFRSTPYTILTPFVTDLKLVVLERQVWNKCCLCLYRGVQARLIAGDLLNMYILIYGLDPD